MRKKLAKATGGLDFIETVWGRGYVLRDPREAGALNDTAMGMAVND